MSDDWYEAGDPAPRPLPPPSILPPPQPPQPVKAWRPSNTMLIVGGIIAALVVVGLIVAAATPDDGPGSTTNRRVCAEVHDLSVDAQTLTLSEMRGRIRDIYNGAGTGTLATNLRGLLEAATALDSMKFQSYLNLVVAECQRG